MNEYIVNTQNLQGKLKAGSNRRGSKNVEGYLRFLWFSNGILIKLSVGTTESNYTQELTNKLCTKLTLTKGVALRPQNRNNFRGKSQK